MYDEIEREIVSLIERDKSIWGEFPVYILGGILINTDETLPNYFSQKTFRRVV